MKKQRQAFGVVEIKPQSKSSFKDKVALLSRGLMVPVAILPLAGILLGLGAAFPQIFGEDNHAALIAGNVIKMPGSIVFKCLPMIFAIAIAITFTKDSGVAGLCGALGWLVMCAIQVPFITQSGDGETFKASFLWYNYIGLDGQQEFAGIFTNGNIPGFLSLNTSVFGGVCTGLLVAFLYNKTKNVQLPTALGFFSGVRFVPIVTILALAGLGMIFAMIWPAVGIGLFYAGKGLSNAPGGINSFIYTLLNRCLIPFGLHHVLSNLIYWTPIGGTWDTSANAIVQIHGVYYQVVSDGSVPMTWAAITGGTGAQIYGEWGIQYELMNYVGKPVNIVPVGGGGDITTTKLTYDMIFRGTEYANGGMYTFNPGQYTDPMGAWMMCCLPAAALAMFFAAPKGDNRKLAGSIVISAGVVSFLTGITEPIEFTFLFLAPWLFWGFHAVMCGVMGLVSVLFTLYLPQVGPHFIGSSLIDLITLGVVQDAIGGHANCWMVVVIGLMFAPIYYCFFSWAIKRYDLQTPGRGSTKLFTKKDFQAQQLNKNGTVTTTVVQSTSSVPTKDDRIQDIIEALGGSSNIVTVEACFTRLRTELKDPGKANKDWLISLGAKGVMLQGSQGYHVIFGTEADVLKNKIKSRLAGED